MGTFIRYLKVQAFVFLCGIVGPIFLIVYFCVPPEPDTKWLYWAGLFVTAGDVLVALGITNASIRADPAPATSAQRTGRG